MSKFRVSFVCSGNICRSPMGEAVLREHLSRSGLGDQVVVDSLGTGPWEVGRPADPRAVRALRKRGYDGDAHIARQVDQGMLAAYDLVLAMDSGHLRELRRLAQRAGVDSDIRLLRSFDPQSVQGDQDVEDPYYNDDAAFEIVLDQIEASVEGLVSEARSAVQR